VIQHTVKASAEQKLREAADPLAAAEAALKKLRANPDDRQAADALEQALMRLKEQAQPKGTSGNHRPGS
jgi:hypothetical protein